MAELVQWSPWTPRRECLVAFRYWQFKNGRTAPIWGDELLRYPHYTAWDRFLGVWVSYAR